MLIDIVVVMLMQYNIEDAAEIILHFKIFMFFVCHILHTADFLDTCNVTRLGIHIVV